MSNRQHRDILKNGVGYWNRWRRDNIEIRPELIAQDLSARNLAGINLQYADLSLVTLSRAFLNQANFNHANLHRVNCQFAYAGNASFKGANLRFAEFNHTDLNHVDLRFADIGQANLNGANLTGANLAEANLTGANLVNTNLSNVNFAGANLTKATVGDTIFSNNDLRGAVGINSIIHAGPSTIGIDTLYKSAGNIPDVFLRGCGMPDDFISYARSLIGQAIEFYSCFISYSHPDKSFARRLHDTLQGRGIRCWLDEYQILPGDDLFEQIDRGIRLWDKVLLCCSEASLTSWWVDNEITIAFEKEQKLMKDRGKKILTLIPLNLDGYLFKWDNGKATQVKARSAVDFTGWKRNNAKFDKEFERLVKAMRADEGSREIPPEPKL